MKRRSGLAAVVLLAAMLVGCAGSPTGRGPAGPSATPTATPTLPPGVVVTREAAIVVAAVNGAGTATVIDARVGRIGDFDPNQQVVPADRLVWAITFSAGNSSTDFVDAVTGEWLEGMSPAPAMIIGSLSTAGLAQASALPGPTSLTTGELIVAVPDGWRFYAMSQVSSFTSVTGVLANFDLGAACGLPDISGGCLQNFTLRPGQALVFLGSAAFPGWTVDGMKPAGGWSALIAGLPASLTTSSSDLPYGASQNRRWQIARQDSEDNRYTVEGYLGSDAAGLAEQVDAIAKGVTLVHPIVPLPTGSSGTAAAAHAVVTALASLRATATGGTGASFYACFPTTPGTARDGTITDSPSGLISAPLPVTCRTDVAATDAQAWRLTLRVSWTVAPTRAAGSMSVMVLVAPDGTASSVTTGGDPLPGSP